MSENHNDNDHKELLDQACCFVERMIDKKIAEDANSARESSKLQARNTWAGIALVVVTLGVGAGGLIYQAHAENKDRDEQMLREANRRKLEIIRDISTAMTSMREFNDIALTYCGISTTAEQKEYLKIERIKREYELVKVTRPRIHFFNNKFRTLVVDYIEWNKAITDYCDAGAPHESQWRIRQKEIEEQMVLAPAQDFADK